MNITLKRKVKTKKEVRVKAWAIVKDGEDNDGQIETADNLSDACDCSHLACPLAIYAKKKDALQDMSWRGGYRLEEVFYIRYTPSSK